MVESELLMELEMVGVHGSHKAGSKGGRGRIENRIRNVGGVVVVLLAEVDPAGDLGQGLESGPVVLYEGEPAGRRGGSIVVGAARVVGSLRPGSGRVTADTVEGEAGVDPLGLGNGRALLGEMSRQALDTAAGEELAAFLGVQAGVSVEQAKARRRAAPRTAGCATYPTGMAVAVAVVLQFLAPLEVLGQQGARPSAHLEPRASLRREWRCAVGVLGGSGRQNR